jgi:hypothetical protein
MYCSTGSWQNVSRTSLTIDTADSPVVPSVSIIAPKVIGSCQSLVIDITSSTGSGGRSWSNTSIYAVSLTANVTAINKFLKSSYKISPPTKIDSSIIPTGSVLNIVVNLCNFFGQCGLANKQILVSSTTLPVVTIAGSNIRKITRSSTVTLDASSYVESCSGTKTYSGLVSRSRL